MFLIFYQIRMYISDTPLPDKSLVGNAPFVDTIISLIFSRFLRVGTEPQIYTIDRIQKTQVDYTDEIGVQSTRERYIPLHIRQCCFFQ